MQVDGQQQPCTTDSDREQDMHSMQAPDLTPKEGVGRCYYTQLPRLVKASKAHICIVVSHCIGIYSFSEHDAAANSVVTYH